MVSRALESRLRRFEELERQLADPAVLGDPKQVAALAKERARLKPLSDLWRELQEVEEHLRGAREIAQASGDHAEMAQLAQAELEELTRRQGELRGALEQFVLGEDPEGDKSAIVEIRAGTGGAEASLFSADLYRMYTRYAAGRSWAVENLSSSGTEVGGFKEVVFGIDGEGAFRRLKFERGVHRVQRVPETEASGRIHTSTVTVAVLPQAEEVDLQVDPKDLRIDVYRSSGPGGQGVNTTDSAVRITHVPTGVVVSCQDERSQMKNKAKAMKVLRARLLEAKTEQQAAQRSQERRSQIGTGDRSEKIRTYNFPDRRITDHRIGFTSHRLEEVLNGNLDELIEPLLEAERQTRLGTRQL
ncbi:MAG: peptide chain release factor 1 [Candidatus Omnitrophica bacterium]|nr:peptide chain release factor 1 [Candidatus Omnitrophota bacterium]